MQDNPILIAIHGKPHSGKDTICNYITDYIPKLKRYGPSVPVKAATAAKFNIPLNYFYNEKLKETVIPFWNLTPREMAQLEGKEASRDIQQLGDDFWLKHVELYLHNKDPLGNNIFHEDDKLRGIILADIRYENEIQWAKKNGGIILFVTRDGRPTVTNEAHPAEHGLPEHLADYIIRNNGTLVELEDKVVNFLELYNLLDNRYL